MKKIIGAFLVCGYLGCALAQAVELEVAPFVGYRSGGNFVNELTGEKMTLNSSDSEGLAVSFSTPKRGQKLEFLYSRESTVLNSAGVTPDIDVDIQTWTGGLLQEYVTDDDRFRPFLEGLLGFTQFDFSGGSGVNNLFTMGMGGGLKYFFRPWIGVRLDGRGYLSFVEGSGGVACSGGCVVSYSGDVFWQWEVGPSVIIKI